MVRNFRENYWSNLIIPGDGAKDEPLVIRGDKLNSGEDLLHEAEKELNNEMKPVSQTKTKLIERVYDLEEGGQTALGPAVIFALNIASKRQGSKIVICTDGKTNTVEKLKLNIHIFVW